MLRVYSTSACLLAISLLAGCWTPEERADAGAGAVEGVKEMTKAVGDALTAWETTGIVGVVTALGLGVWRAISKGMARANRRKSDAATSGQG